MKLSLPQPCAVPKVPLFLLITAALPTLAILLPLAYLMLRTATLGMGEFLAVVSRPRNVQVLLNSVGIALLTPLSAALIAVPLAFLTVRTDLPGRRFWLIATTLPLAIPDYVICFALIATLGPKGSLLQLWLEPLGVEQLPELYGWPGALLALTLITYPYMLLSAQAGLQCLDPRMDEAARSLGCTPQATFLRVVLPQLRPAIMAGGLVVAMYALQDFSATTLMRFDTFTRAIFLQYRYTFDRHQAAALALVLVGLILGLLWVESRVRPQGPLHGSGSSVRYDPAPMRLGVWKIPALLFCLGVTALGLVLPFTVTLVWLVRGFTHTGWSYEMTSWRKLLLLGEHSLVAAGSAAAIATLCALPIALLAVRFPSPLATAIERCSYIGFGLPGIVIALSLVYWGAHYLPWLYQTLPMLIFAYLAMFLPQSVGAIRSVLVHISPQLEESARSLGRTPWQTLQEVTLPLMRPGLISGAMLVFLTAVKELPATLLLAPIGFNTLSAHIWQATESVSYSDAAAGSALMLVVSLSLTLLLLGKARGRGFPPGTVRLRDFD